MKKIALEEHFLSPEFEKYTRNDFAAMNEADVSEFIAKLMDLDHHRIKEMDKAGIEIAVLSLTTPGVQTEKDTAVAIALAQSANDFLAERISKHPKRYRGFAHLAMQDPEAAAKELERCVKQHHFVGALINGQTYGKYLDEEMYYPFWKKVQDLDVPVYLHPGSPYVSPQNYKYHPELEGAVWGWTVGVATHALRLVFSGLFDRFPKVKLILGHLGETLPYLLWRLDSRWNIMHHARELRKQPSQYFKENVYVTTSGMCVKGPLLCALAEMGEDHVMFSVDYPYESSELAYKFIETVPLDEKIREKVCYQNAQRLLKL